MKGLGGWGGGKGGQINSPQEKLFSKSPTLLGLRQDQVVFAVFKKKLNMKWILKSTTETSERKVFENR